jgi:hypothetical protein
MPIKFHVQKEVDPVLLKSRAKKEAEFIGLKDTTRNGRSDDDILETCLWGQAPEVWLMSQGYLDDPRPYRDVREPQGVPVEVKVTENKPYGRETGVDFVLKRCKAKRLQTWGKSPHPDRVIIFINDRHSPWYELHGVYDWNGEDWIYSGNEIAQPPL